MDRGGPGSLQMGAGYVHGQKLGGNPYFQVPDYPNRSFGYIAAVKEHMHTFYPRVEIVTDLLTDRNADDAEQADLDLFEAYKSTLFIAGLGGFSNLLAEVALKGGSSVDMSLRQYLSVNIHHDYEMETVETNLTNSTNSTTFFGEGVADLPDPCAHES